MTDTRKHDLALLLLRLALGGLMLAQHGWKKVVKLFTGDPTQFADPIGLGAPVSLGLTAFAEVGCSFLLIVGLFTRLATIPLIITMAVIVFIVHWADPFGDKEMALLYMLGYVAILLAGPGWYSVDARMRKV